MYRTSLLYRINSVVALITAFTKVLNTLLPSPSSQPLKRHNQIDGVYSLITGAHRHTSLSIFCVIQKLLRNGSYLGGRK